MLDNDDAEHVVVDINDSGDRFVEFTGRSVCFQQAERGGEIVGTLDYADRDEALAIDRHAAGSHEVGTEAVAYEETGQRSWNIVAGALPCRAV
ncbi:hypothetical protein [Amycolatopsis sp. NPDC057786]|uniref:hypothetical protein n=1 Tax=Amycolatopsis sp. NPDC057786 TaxID=3346250 RepID=UPI00366E3580